MKSKALQNPLKEVLGLGQSLWYDGLISSEEFSKMISEDGLRGATTNPSIFEKAIGASGPAISGGGASAEEVYTRYAVGEVRRVADLFLPVFRASGGQDGFVSMEVSPLLAFDTRATLEEARRLHALIARENLMIKIPATREGLPAIEVAIAEGIHVNVTLIFSVQRHREVMEAFVRGLEKRAASGKSVSQSASVASFFVSRVDTEVDKLLEQRIVQGQTKLVSLLGKAAIANSKVAYAEFGKVFASERFQKLRKMGAHAQRPLWASTGTKNPRYSDVCYVEELIGPDTVNTMPPQTLSAYRDHGQPAARLEQGLDEAKAVLAALRDAGIDLDLVTDELEANGVKLFADSYRKIIEGIHPK